IPVSVALSLALMKAFNIGINIMSLGGLAIGTSIIVDNTIVVLENIFRWLSTPALRGRKSHSEVVIEATVEVIKPVIVSTLANIAIFIPMVWVAGFAGRLFTPVSFTVTFALMASLVVAVMVVPVLVDVFLAGRVAHQKEKEHTLFPAYEKPLKYALKKPLPVVIAGFALVVAAGLVFPRLNSGFLPELDEGAVLLNVQMPPGVSLQESQRFSSKLENWLKGLPGVVTVSRRTGHAAGAQDTDNLNHSDIMVKLLPKSKRPMPLDDFLNLLQSKTDPLAGAQITYLMPLADKINDALGGVPADLGVDLFGQDTAKLHEYASKLLAQMQKVPGLTNLKPPTDIPVPSLEIKVDRKKAGDLGITEQTLNDTLSAYANTGLVATSIHELLKEINVTLFFGAPGHNLDWENLKSLPLKTVTGATVPLEEVASLQYGEIPSEIYHYHMTRKLTVSADIQCRNAKDAAADVAKIVEGLHLAPGYSWGFSGKFETGQEALLNMLMVLALAVFMVAFILWLEFKSLIQVLLILLTVPLA
ncbi:MAG: efflux RND transporter permease subunit, partial [Candidatus Dormibacteraceae bacterium]